MRIAYITNASRWSGIGHRAYKLRQKLQSNPEIQLVHFKLDGEKALLSKNGRPVRWITPWPGMLGSKSVNWIRLGRALASYLTTTNKDPFDLYHCTAQSLSFLLPRFEPSVITIHDLVELIDPQDRKALLLNQYLHRGIPRARHIVAVSEYTKKTIMERYKVTPANITVIQGGVDPSEFHPIENFDQTIAAHQWRQNLKIDPAAPVVLYVGSEHPRKNVSTAMRAFLKVKEDLPQAVLLKVGDPGLPAGRQALLEEIDALHIREAVRIIGHISDQELNEIYNLAAVLIFPSRFEGFGMPPLQAMAAGTPVVVSNATSLPEVVGEAGLWHDPDDVEGFAGSMLRVLSNQEFALELKEKGMKRAALFSWDQAAKMLVNVYRQSI